MKNFSSLSEDVSVILNLVISVGCISKTQALEILAHGDNRNNPRLVPEKVLAFLINNRYLKYVDEEHLTVLRNPRLSSEAVDCLWVMLDQIKQEDEDGGYYYRYSDIAQTIMGDMYMEFSYIQDESVTINMLELNSENASKMMAIQQRFYAHTKSKLGKEKDLSYQPCCCNKR